MALSSEKYKTIFNCTGGTTYDFDFKVFEETSLEVIRVTAAGVESTLTLTADYSTSLLTEIGGRVTTVAVYADGQLVVRRAQPQTQDVDYTQNDSLSTVVLEEQLDKIVMMIQNLEESIARTILQSSTETTQVVFPSPDSEKLIGWDTAGTALENKTALDADIQAACEAAQAAAELAETAAEAAQVAAEAAAATIPTPVGETVADMIRVNAAQNAYELFTPAFGDMYYANTRTKIGTLTRELDAATGVVAYTGVGFQPTTIFFFGGKTATAIMSLNGLDNGTVKYCQYDKEGVVNISAGFSIGLYETAAKSQTSYISALGADGFSLTWTRTGVTAAGTAYMYYLAFR